MIKNLAQKNVFPHKKQAPKKKHILFKPTAQKHAETTELK